MQVNNNNYQPNFKSVKLAFSLKKAIAEGRIKDKSIKQIKEFESKYAKTPITVILDKADCQTNRLDAQVYYGEPATVIGDRSFEYRSENPLTYFLGFGHKSFLNKIGQKVELLEESFQVGRYAK